MKEMEGLSGFMLKRFNSSANAGSKIDLVGGLLPEAIVPEKYNDVSVVNAYSDLPITGEGDKLYVCLATASFYCWSSNQYLKLADPAIATMQASITSLGQNISTIQDSVNNNSSDILTMQTQLGDISTTLDNINGTVV